MEMHRDLGQRAADIARALHAEPSVALTAQAVVDMAVSMLDGCDAAGIILVRRKQLTTVAHTHELVLTGDALQYELAEGPCLDALAPNHDEVESRDLAAEHRWPRWAPRVVEELGVRSMLSFRLFTPTSLVGALNLYSFTPDSFTPADHDEGHVLASQAAIALSTREHLDDLKVAVSRRTTIGQAQGILMERYHLDPDQAFAVLTRLSRNGNRKLYDVAGDIVSTRAVPDALGSTEGRSLTRP